MSQDRYQDNLIQKIEQAIQDLLADGTTPSLMAVRDRLKSEAIPENLIRLCLGMERDDSLLETHGRGFLERGEMRAYSLPDDLFDEDRNTGYEPDFPTYDPPPANTQQDRHHARIMALLARLIQILLSHSITPTVASVRNSLFNSIGKAQADSISDELILLAIGEATKEE